MAKKLLVGIDLGGTSLLAVAATPKGKILGAKKTKTLADEGANAVLGRIIDVVKTAVARAGAKMKNVRAIGIGFPGPLDPDRGIVLHAPNLGPTWNNLSLTDYLTEKLGPPAFLGNDVNVGAIGEHALGAGRGVDNLVSIFVGTGIGGGIILNGKLYRGARNTAGEVGHMIIVAGGPRCGCGKRGCAEAVASRTAIERDIHAGLKAGQQSALPQIWQKMNRTDLSSSVLAAALKRGDPLVTKVMEKAQYYMGLLVANVVNLIEPQVIVLGGGLVERLGDAYLDPVRETAEQYYTNQHDKHKIRIVESKLQDNAGVLGAAIMANQAWKRKK